MKLFRKILIGHNFVSFGPIQTNSKLLNTVKN